MQQIHATFLDTNVNIICLKKYVLNNVYHDLHYVSQNCQIDMHSDWQHRVIYSTGPDSKKIISMKSTYAK